MDTPATAFSADISPLLLAQVFAESVAPRVVPSLPQARMSVAVVGHGVWSFDIAAPAVTRAAWDEAAALQILCDEAALHSVATGAPISADRLFLVSGNDDLLRRLGGLFAGGGTPLQVRLGGAS
jgi:hypothetical protein